MHLPTQWPAARLASLVCRYAVAAAGVAVAAQAQADMPPATRTASEQTFAFGDISIKQSVNSMKDPMSPEFKLRVYKKGKLVLDLKDAAFDAFYPAPDKQAFVGLSNHGWPATAAIVLDRDGKILLLARHGEANLSYCMETSTLLKHWYDAQDPQVRVLPGHTPAVTVKDCRGGTVNLQDVVSQPAGSR